MENKSLKATFSTEAVVRRFNEALNNRDLEGMMALLTVDSVFENTYPPPDGARYVGQAAVRSFWEDFFKGASHIHLETEEIFALGDRCVMRWVYHWDNAAGQSGHIRGVDIYRLSGGLIAEKLSYVKG